MKEFLSITSRENSLIKLVSALQSSGKKRRENGLFVLEGLRICKDAYDNGIRFDKLIISRTAEAKYSDDINAFVGNAEEGYILPDSLFEKISDTKTPQGIIAISKINNRSFDEINKNGKYVALENVADPSNLGAVARTAEALGVDGIILSQSGCDPYSPKALRASMGTLLRMPIYILNDFSKEIVNLGIKTYACVVESSATEISKCNFSGGSAVIIGNEANGITEETKNAADENITIPMSGRAESLNAAAAAAIAIWEMIK